MIHVTYDKCHNYVTITGHAGCAPKGHDLVCAAVSALALTLAGNVAYLESQEAVYDAILKLEEGNAVIKCTAYRKHKETVEQIFRTICVGFELLSTKYPENIFYEMRCLGVEKAN